MSYRKNRHKAFYITALHSDYSTVVFAETNNKARSQATKSESMEGVPFTDVRAHRYPEADHLYKGAPETDWDDPETRVELVKELGWHCFEAEYTLCRSCPAAEFCEAYRDTYLKEDNDE